MLYQRMAFQPGVARGFPDYMFMPRGGRPIFIEFKAPGKKPTALQVHRMQELGNHDYAAYWRDDADKAIEMIKQFMAS